MTFDEFKKACFHTKLKLRIPLLNSYIDKVELFNKGKYCFKKEKDILKDIYINNKERLK